MLHALARRQPIHDAAALIVAHPDDETIALGGSMHLFRNLLLVHVTDGAPRRLADAERQGFTSPAAYAAARARELDAALSLSGANPARIAIGIPDQDATDHIPEIAAQLRDLFRDRDIACVLTHAYEGGHPDHDAVAYAVHLAAPEIYEFAGYHAAPEGGLRTGKFLGDAGATVPLPPADQHRKRAMVAQFTTQRDILAHFATTQERFRPAPHYDFNQPPHPGRLLYEEWGWMTGAAWRERVAAVPCGV